MAEDTLSLAKAALVGELELQRDAVRQLAAPLSEEEFWRKPLDPGNSVGHLVLHLSGNLNWMVGAKLGNTGYVRDREREFTETAVPAKAVALGKLDEAVATFRRVVESLDAAPLAAPHPGAPPGPFLPAPVHLVRRLPIHPRP